MAPDEPAAAAPRHDHLPPTAWILGPPAGWHASDLQRALTLHDVQVDFRLWEELADEIPGPGCGSAAAIVFVRFMPRGTLEQVIFRMDVLAAWQQRRAIVINPPKALECAIDKYLCLWRLARAGLPVPPTITCQSEHQAIDAFRSLGGHVVVKPLFGSLGKGLRRLTSESSARGQFARRVHAGEVIYLQQFIPHDFDIRVLMIGQQALAIKRSNPSDWRCNVACGASCQSVELTPELRSLAARAARAVGAPVAGVDLLIGQDGQPRVTEVNAVPGWQAISATLGIDVADRIVRFALQCTPAAPAKRGTLPITR